MGLNVRLCSRRPLLTAVVWLIILVTPTSLWLAFTSNGHGAWHLLFARDAPPGNRPMAAANVTPLSSGRPRSRGVVLIPAVPRPTHPQLQVQLYGNRTIGLVVVDTKGRRSGIDWKTMGKLHEIPNSRVRRQLIEEHGGAKHEVITVTVDPALSPVYSLAIAAKRPGDFRLAVGGVSPALNRTRHLLSDRVPEATRLHYRIDLDDIPPPLRFGPTNGPRATVIKPGQAFVAQTKSEVIEPTAPALVAAAAAMTKDPCGYFYERLKAIPHERFTRTDGEYQSIWDGKHYRGCQVVLVTTDALLGDKAVPAFAAAEGSYLYKLGWRVDNALVADGPGSSAFGIENRSRLCLVSNEQPAELDMKAHQIIQSDTLTLTIQCRHR